MTTVSRSLALATLLAVPAVAMAQDAPVLAVISHPVADYAIWRGIYDDFSDAQRAGGVIMEQVYQDPANPNEVLVLHGFESLETARGFLSSDELKSAMQGAGVAGPPSVMIVSRAE